MHHTNPRRPGHELAGTPLGQEIRGSGPDFVQWLQRSLNQVLGLRLAVDGVMGAQTRSAVRDFQRRRGLAVDGIPGPRTRAALEAALAGSVWPAAAAAGQDCQQELVLEGFAFDSDLLTAAHGTAIASLARQILAGNVGLVRIVGHTDPVGSASYNLGLGQRRAEAVAQELRSALEHARPGSAGRVRFAVESRGESQPIPGSAVRSRRVHVCVVPARPGRPPAPTPQPPRPPGPGPRPPDPARELRRWFTTGGRPAMQPVRSGNRVTTLVGGRATFEAMVRAIRTAKNGKHYIYLLGWHLTDGFELVPGDRGSTMRALFSRASQQGVQVRAMLWDQFGTQNSAEVGHINGLSNGAAILDNRTVSRSSAVNLGVHHQKVLIVRGDQGLITFCGGVDINPDRIHAAGSSGGSGSGSGSGSGGGGGGSPLHDVHCQIQGPAAWDLLKVFVERWTDHPDHVALDRSKGRLRGLREPLPRPAGSYYVQIGRTYGNGRRHSKVPGGYAFAPSGEATIRRMVLRAISQARRFIYIEDQYLVSMEVSRALVRALPRIQHLTIVIPHSSLLSSQECPQHFHRRRRSFIAPLRAAGGSKVRVFHLHPPGTPNTYVHSKMWVIDDELAIIGSANCNRRGYTHDSEVAAAIYDPDRRLAQDLRVRLWAKHLNMNTPAGRRALADGVASARFWLARPAGARVAPFNERSSISAGESFHCRVASWDTHIDPDGS